MHQVRVQVPTHLLNGMLLEGKKVYVGPFLKREARPLDKEANYTNVYIVAERGFCYMYGGLSVLGLRSAEAPFTVIEAPFAPIAPVTNNIQGLLGRVNEFSSEKESKMSFAAWAQIFEENAELRGIPEESWTPLAKTNLAGKAKERWLQAEAALPPGTSSTWRIFKEKLTPLFAEADKRASAKRAYGKLEQNGCRDNSADALREYGRQFLAAFTEMGTERTVTEKGAIIIISLHSGSTRNLLTQ